MILLLLAWTWTSLPLARLEWLSILYISQLLKMDSHQKRIANDGLIYVLLKRAQDVIPAGSRVIVLLPSLRQDGGDYLEGKTRYYLFHTHLSFVFPGSGIKIQELRNQDFLLIFLQNRNSFQNQIQQLDSLPFMEKIFQFDSPEEGYQSIYKVKR